MRWVTVSLTVFFSRPRQIADVQVQVSQNTEALQGAQMEKSDLSRQIQTLEIELASQQSLVSVLLPDIVDIFISFFISYYNKLA